MAIIAPFKGLTYNFKELGDIPKLMAPPYDVISEEEQEEYYQTDPYNIIRLIKRYEPFHLEPFLEGLKRWFEITLLPFSGSRHSSLSMNLKEMLEKKGGQTSVIGFHHHMDDKCYILSLKPGLRDEMGDDLPPPLKKLDVLVLSRLILQKTLGFSKEDLDNEEIFHYHSDMAKALSLVDSGVYQMAFLLNPTKIEHVKEVASNSLIMPRKSTFFYPKVLSGLVINKIDPYEITQVP